MKTRRGSDREGFSVVEALVALLLALIVLMVACTEFIDAARHHHAQSQIAGMHQNARNVVEFFSRDLMPAGYGLTEAPLGASPVIANEPTILGTFSNTAITFRYNAEDITSQLSADMASATSDFKVSTTSGFAKDQRIMIWDDSGTWDWTDVSAVSSATVLKHGGGLSKAYLVGNMPRVSAMREISFRYNAATREIERMADGGLWSAVARNVVGFELHYRDVDGNEIFPADDATRAAIRTVELRLTVRTEEQDLVLREFRTYQVITTVAPRNLENFG